MNKNIFYHADDFGRSKLISKNISRCIKHGYINSISIMMNFYDFIFKNLTKIKKLKKIKLHINLTEKTNKSLLSMDYSFFKLVLIRFSKNYPKYREEVLNEIKSQIILYKKVFKKKLIAIDSHEHVHMIPWIFDIIIELSQKYNISEIRIPKENFFLCKTTDIFNINYLLNLLKLLIINFFWTLCKPNIKKIKIINFTGLVYSGIQNQNSIVAGIKQYFKNKANIEVLLHPGHTNITEKKKFKNKYYKYYSSINRIREYKLIRSKNIF